MAHRGQAEIGEPSAVAATLTELRQERLKSVSQIKTVKMLVLDQ